MQTLKSWLSQHCHSTETESRTNNTNQLRLLLQHLLKQSSAWIYAHPEHQLTSHQIEQLRRWLKDLKTGKPLAYITGEQMFWDLCLKVNQHTLIPRPDTEIIIEAALELLQDCPPQNILDLGTGSGALALVLAKQFPQSQVTAVDLSSEALEVAKDNAKRYNISNVKFIKSDWFAGLTAKQFDLIVSNPPYISPEDEHLNNLQHEPRGALVAVNNGLANYLSITDTAIDFLKKGGMLMFEHGWQQKHDVRSLLAAAGFKDIGSRKDLAGHDRVTFGFRSSKQTLKT